MPESGSSAEPSMAAGPDAPETLRSQDYLQRWRVARSIYELIKTSPPHWSLRVGIYGRWGEGKTTILRFIETMAKEDGYPLALFNPWSIEDRQSMWEALSNEVERALGRSKLTGPRINSESTP